MYGLNTNHSIASSSPSPFTAEVLNIDHGLLLSAERPRALETSVADIAPSMSWRTYVRRNSSQWRLWAPGGGVGGLCPVYNCWVGDSKLYTYRTALYLLVSKDYQYSFFQFFLLRQQANTKSNKALNYQGITEITVWSNQGRVVGPLLNWIHHNT